MSKKTTKTYKIPKRIAGYKIPKRLRRQAKPLLKLAATPQFASLLGVAIAAGSAALAEPYAPDEQRKSVSKAKKKAARRLRFLAAEGRDRASDLAENLGRTIGQAIAMHRPRGQAGSDHGSPTAH